MKNLDHMNAMAMLEWAVALLGEMLETIDNAMDGDHPARAEIVAFLDAVSGNSTPPTRGLPSPEHLTQPTVRAENGKPNQPEI